VLAFFFFPILSLRLAKKMLRHPHPLSSGTIFLVFCLFFTLVCFCFLLSAFFSKKLFCPLLPRASDVAAFSRRFFALDREKVETFVGDTLKAW
jgi:predicted permease